MTEIVPTVLTIHSEADAWRVLEQAIRNELPEGALEVDFDGWPVFTIRLKGRHFDASLTASVMEGLVELQRNLNRTYARLRYHRATGAVLTDEEKARLEFTVRVDPGSSLAKIDLTEVFKTFVERAVAKMEPMQLVATMVGLAAIYGATVCWKRYVGSQLETRKISADTEARLALSREETRRLAILAEALHQHPRLQAVQDEADEGRNAVLKGLKQAESVTLDGLELDQEAVHLAVRQPRSPAVETRRDGNYRVRKLDNSPADHYKVFVLGPDGREFAARLDNRFASAAAEWARLGQALKTREPVYLKANVREVRGEIRDATILEVGDPTDTVASR